MTLTLLVAILAPVLAGLVCTVGLWTRQVPTVPLLVLMVSLSVGLGFGLSACASFLSLSLFGASPHRLIVTDVGLQLLLGTAYLWAVARRAPLAAADAPVTGLPAPRLRWLLGGSLAITLVCALLTFLLLSLRNPQGAWDAWAIWNLRARFIVRAGSGWRDAFTGLLGWSHPDYPLLLPLSVARLWQYLGWESQTAPTAIAMLFTFSTVALAWASLAILRTPSQAALAALLLLGTSALVMAGPSQIADVPLGFFILATLAVLALKDRMPERARYLLVVTGMTTGLCAWTKNEGLLVVVSVIFARASLLWRSRGWRSWQRELPAFVAGLAPVLLVVLYFKLALAPANDLVSHLGWREAVPRLLAPERYVEVIRGFKNALIDLGDATLINPLLVLLFYLVCVGIEPDERDGPGLTTGLVTLGLMVIGYGLVYLTTSQNLAWHRALPPGASSCSSGQVQSFSPSWRRALRSEARAEGRDPRQRDRGPFRRQQTRLLLPRPRAVSRPRS